jgi:hypothetical protein
MKKPTAGLIWAIFLIAVGVLLLLTNLDVFGTWGQAGWGGLLAVAGLIFVVSGFGASDRWWRLIPGFTLLGAGAAILLEWGGIALGNWEEALLVFGPALGFWVAWITNRAERWWSFMPAGIITVLALLAGMQQYLVAPGRWQAAFLLGTGVVFGLVALLRLGQADTKWAVVPAAGLGLLGLSNLVGSFNVPQFVKNWWPIALAIGGGGLLVYQLNKGKQATPAPAQAAPPKPASEAVAPAPGASVTELPPATAAPAAASEKDVDIYSLLEQQPKEDASG